MKKKVEIEKIYPLSPMQEGMLFHTLENPGSTAYFEQNVFRIDGDIDIPLLEKSFNRIVQRYDVFRTIFKYEKLKQPLQILLKERQLKMHFEDISHLSETEVKSYLEEFKRKDRLRGFNLEKDILMRVSLLKNGTKGYVLIWDFHHILMDGWCISIIYNDLVRVYQALQQKKPVRLEPVTPYWRYIQWLGKQDKEKGLSYWEMELDGYEQPVTLPGVGLVGQNAQYRLENYSFVIDGELKEGLESITRDNQVTLNVLFQTLWGILMQKYNDTDDVVFGAVVSGRPAEIEGVEGMVGLFINTIPVRVRTIGTVTFMQLVRQVHHKATEAKDFEYLQLAQVQNVSTLKRELIQHIITFESYPVKEMVMQEKNGFQVKFAIKNHEIFEQTNYDFNIIVTPGKNDHVRLSFNSLVYETGMALRLEGHLKELIRQVIHKPEIEVRTLGIMTEAERWCLLMEFNNHGKTTDLHGNNTILTLFRHQVRKTPDHTALVSKEEGGKGRRIKGKNAFGEIQLTYNVLNDITHQLAQLLRQKGVVLDTIVGIMPGSSIEMIIGILGILTSGGAFLPIDPDYPKERIACILKDSGAKVLVVDDTSCASWLSFTPNAILNLSEGYHLNFPASQLPSFPASLPSSLAYVIYTSGSTGKPRGVMIEHLGLMNYICWAAKTYVKNEVANFPLFTSISFDLTITSLFLPLVTGSTIILYGGEDAASVIEDVLKNPWVEIVKLTPSHLKLIQGDQKTSYIKYFIVGGEQLTTRLAKDIHDHFGSEIEIFNEYGPTETVVGCMIHCFNPGEDQRNAVPIGHPIDNIGIYILNRQGQPVSVGVTGEIYISGNGIARGYLNQPELTAKKFKIAVIRHSSLVIGDIKRAVNSHLSLVISPSKKFSKSTNSADNQCPMTNDKLSKSTNDHSHSTRRSNSPSHSPHSPHSPYSPYSTIYQTGDLARHLPDGNIEYIGRKDFQIKIKGYRIELSEIESHLQKHDAIKQAVVVVREIADWVDNGKYLCAYLVTGQHRDSISPGFHIELRDYLLERLPHYMVPAHFITLENIPLTPNGKLDRSALSGAAEYEGDGLTGMGHRPPRGPIEKKLVEIWQGVLGKNPVGIDDNFFMIGGDSIKSLQVASRMNREGFKIKVKDILQYPTISALVPHVKTGGLTAEQGLISGTLPLTPIQAEFFHHTLTTPHHYNQALMMFSSSQEGVFHPGVIKTIFSRLWQHHDALRLTFKKEPQGIIQTNGGLETTLSLSVYDYRHKCQQDALQQLERTANKIQASFDLEKGPLMKVAIFQLEDGNRLLVVIHHLVIDGVSWRILLEDIDTLYRQYKKGEPMQLPPKTDSFKKWADKLSRFANSDSFLKEKYYWAGLESTAETVSAIAKDFETEDNFYKDAHSLSISLSKTETQRLLTKTNQAYGTEINDIMLTALGLGMKKTWGHNRFIIALEGHGREDIINDVDITRTVGWFTCIYPVQLDVSMGDNWEQQIKEIKEELRRVPNKGIGWGILKYLTQPQHKEGIRLQFTPQVKFNYLGQLDSDVHKRSFAVARESVGDSTSPEAQRENQIDVVGIISGGKLLISITYSKKQYKTDTIRMLLENYQSALTTIISYCCSRKERVLTPSDLTYKGLSIAMVDRLRARFPHLEDIYPLSPMQQGMLFHSLDRKNRTTYFQQVSYRLHGHLDRYLVEKSLNELFKRHDILRTVFVYSEVDTPLQAVLEDRRVDFCYQDLRKMAEEDREEFIRQFKEKDKKRPFDLSRDVLMRVSILQASESAYEFTWSSHHIIMDGWCINILIVEFQEIYHSFTQNRPYRLQEATPYREYIKWLDKQESEHTLKYWEKYLSGYEGELSLSKKKQKARDVAQYKNERISFTLDREISIRLNRLLVQNKITLNTIFTTLWGILLGIYKGKQDVVFGMVVSGRPAQIKGIESMVGLFINTIPFRVKYQPKTTVKELLMRVQGNVIQQEPHQYYPLAKILSRVPGKKLLIDHILNFVNYPTAERIEGLVKQDKKNENREPGAGPNLMLVNASTYEQSNYDLNVIVFSGSQLIIEFRYNANVYEKNLLEKINHHLKSIVNQVIENENLRLKDIKLSYDLLDAELNINNQEYDNFSF